MHVYLDWMYVCDPHVCLAWSPEPGASALELELQMVESLSGSWELNLGPLHEELLLLTPWAISTAPKFISWKVGEKIHIQCSGNMSYSLSTWKAK